MLKQELKYPWIHRAFKAFCLVTSAGEATSQRGAVPMSGRLC